MGKRAKPTTIISASLGVAGYLLERGLDMAGITLSLGWAFVLWVISGILILLAGIIAFKVYVWPFIRTIRIKRVTTKEAIPSHWLEQLLEGDKTNMGSRIYARDYIWDFKKLTVPDPYIDLVFTVINAAMFAINIQGVTGRFLIEEHECAQEAEFTGSKRISHGERQNIRIRQRLTRDMAELIISRRDLIPTSKMDVAKKGRANISLRACYLTIKSEIEGELPKPIPFAIGGDYEVNIP